ncbi:undecaprenyl-diphosphatase [Kandleria vitulina]|jgi:undecaprenyl-diphosphatase|uniref:Undecaprenyl-diphosphatase n=2 Tax=Kandleria vitulina TaxID=1630 RepID=A0A0R2HLC3_9FIRM|nr:undecaprenyl-diphosphate phosphatase [Kandleria vitulina]KRN50615.1 undecaprenyl-diphosphatase [Kandleria vitulina DSM 20405]MEE0988593.1 undecaprenyl-diphosphate phosphatase [Kandleria vitulina]SDL65589.1 undecaprenyl-diphosphatase [Kandleria vitulina]SDW36342.1 undecaprenyl-diphosphatase [Kandleria vitulina]SEI65903.1 undecaprenyl-diphosphatase [Kandleria vitulina]
MITYLLSLFFGIVEGITEWLPVSSTGHLIILESFLNMKKMLGADFYSMFEVVIQLGAIMAVVVIFWNEIWPFRNKQEEEGIKRYVDFEIINLWLKILVACVPAAIVGVLFDELFEKWFYNPLCVSIALIVFGVAFIVVENKNKDMKPRVRSLKAINGKTAFLIGMFQLIAAIFPGTSRSGATIVGALMIGVSRTVAAEFTFFLAIPVMFGASLLKMVKFGFAFTSTQLITLIIGCVVSFAVSMVIIKFLMAYIKKHDFKVFGWYRIILGILVLLLGVMGVITTH